MDDVPLEVLLGDDDDDDDDDDAHGYLGKILHGNLRNRGNVELRHTNENLVEKMSQACVHSVEQTYVPTSSHVRTTAPMAETDPLKMDSLETTHVAQSCGTGRVKKKKLADKNASLECHFEEC